MAEAGNGDIDDPHPGGLHLATNPRNSSFDMI